MPTTSLDHQAIQDFINFKQNTHRQVVSASVGKVLLKLNQIYFPDTKITDDIYQETLSELSSIAKEDAQSSVEFVKKQAAQAVDKHDCFTLYDENNSPTHHIVSLKETLVLVWRAINDNQAYQHHLNVNSTEAIEENRQHRIDNFFQNLIRIENDPVCHHGIRNETAFILNHTYKDVEIIEDVKLAIYDYLKREIFKAFYKAQHIDKKDLKSVLLIWMQDNNPSPLIDCIDPRLHKKLHAGLHLLFKQHGSNPEVLEIKNTIDQTFTELEFYMDDQSYPVLAKLNRIMNWTSKNEKAAQVLRHMQEWIKDHYSLDNSAHNELITDFHFMYTAHEQIQENINLLTLTGDLTPEITTLEKDIPIYFQSLIESKECAIVTGGIQQRIQIVTQLITQVKKNKLVPQIENFFSLWFAANSTSQGFLYKTLLLNQNAIQKIYVSDEEIEEFHAKALSADNKKDITLYQINRIFLHAIINDPLKWTSKFFHDAFVPTLNFVTSQFNQTNNALATVVIQSSYPPELLTQLAYLKNRHLILHPQEYGAIEALARPITPMILLPGQISTAQEWVNLSNSLATEKKQWETIYLAYRIALESKLIPAIDRKNYSLSKELCSSIPPRFHESFVKKILSDANKTSFVLRIILDCTSDFSEFFTLLNKLDEQGLAQLPEVLITPNEIGCTGLQDIARNSPDHLAKIITLAEQFPKGSEKIVEALFIQDKEMWTGLHLIIQYTTKCIPQILEILKKVPGGTHKLAQHFSLQDENGWTDLHQITRHAPEYLPQFLTLLETAKEGPEQLAQALMSKNNFNNTGLHLLTRQTPDALIDALMIVEKSHSGIEKVVEVLFLQNDEKWSSFYQIIVHAPTCLSKILEILKKAPGGTDKLARHFSLQDNNGWTALHMMASYAPEYLPQFLTILETVKRGPKKPGQSLSGIEKIVEVLFLQDKNNWTGLHQIIQYAPKCLPQILEILKKAPGGTDKLARHFSLQDNNGWTALHMMASYAPEYLPQFLTILETVKRGPKKPGQSLSGIEKIIEVLFLQNKSNWTSLHQIIQYAPKCLPKILEILKKAPDGADKLAQHFSLQDKNGWTDLHQITRYAPEYLPQFLTLLETAKEGPEQLAQALLLKNRANKNGFSMLMDAPSSIMPALQIVKKAKNGSNKLAHALISETPFHNTGLHRLAVEKPDILFYALRIAANGFKKLAIEELQAEYPLIIQNPRYSLGHFSLATHVEARAAKKLMEALRGGSYKLSYEESLSLKGGKLSNIIKKYKYTDIIPDEFCSTNEDTTEMKFD